MAFFYLNGQAWMPLCGVYLKQKASGSEEVDAEITYDIIRKNLLLSGTVMAMYFYKATSVCYDKVSTAVFVTGTVGNFFYAFHTFFLDGNTWAPFFRGTTPGAGHMAMENP